MTTTPAPAPAPGTLAWFEVASDDPDGAEKFYGSLFDWSFAADGPADRRVVEQVVGELVVQLAGVRHRAAGGANTPNMLPDGSRR